MDEIRERIINESVEATPYFVETLNIAGGGSGGEYFSEREEAEECFQKSVAAHNGDRNEVIRLIKLSCELLDEYVPV